ncbi:hypothetical protein BDV06DRAFT_141478 [Aspergillus oleicola]
MGQGNSTAQSGPKQSDGKDGAKKDYYDLLEVEHNASPEEIKKAYRRKALELHPDRNFGRVEAATNLFAEIQAAYEVLSDPQERSWYDSHREAFLGGDGESETTDFSYNMRMTTAADILQLFSKFSPHMDFTDSSDGFYGGLRETFAQLALEEQMACRWENMDMVDYPSFGSRDDAFEAVRDFYAIWGSFSTKKSYSWKDVYRYSEAPDRRVRRLMEKENKRLRDAAIREFNEAVRSLVAFAKKRDSRYKSYKDSLSQNRDATRQSAASQATRSRAANHAKLRQHVQQDWAQSGELDDAATECSEEEEDETEHFECIACRKTFKSQNQFQAHERSKKHIKAVKQLRREMKMQHDELNLGDMVDDSNGLATAGDVLEDDIVNVSSAPYEKTSDIPSDVAKPGESKTSINSNPSITEESYNLNFDYGTERNTLDPIISEHEVDYAPREVLEQRLNHGDSPTQSPVDNVDDLSERLSASRLDQQGPMKIGKAKQKRVKKAQLAAEKSQLPACTICKESFPSRNKLFSHIKSHQQR